MTGRQFVAVKFRPGDRRTYTYHWDGEPFACGDVVKAPDKDGDGWQRVTVHEISWEAPAFTTKAILGRVDVAPAAPPPPAAEPAQAELPSILDRFRR